MIAQRVKQKHSNASFTSSTISGIDYSSVAKGFAPTFLDIQECPE